MPKTLLAPLDPASPPEARALPLDAGRAIVRDALARARTGDPDALDAAARAWEQALARADARRGLGAWYTPPGMADDLVAEATRGRREPATRVLDPACGTGDLLLAVLRQRRALGVTGEGLLAGLVGIDVDPVALTLAGLRLRACAGVPLGAEVPLRSTPPGPTRDDTLVLHWTSALSEPTARALEGAYDLVIANPPFGSPLHVETRRDEAENAALRRRFPAAAHGTFDRSACFVELGLRACRPGGTFACIAPAALRSATWAGPLRAWFDGASLGARFVALGDGERFADAHVTVFGVVAERGPNDRGPVAEETRAGSWQIRGTAVERALRAMDTVALREVAEVRASATVDEGYRWRDSLQERAEASPEQVRLLTSGAIDPFVHTWGERAQRYLGARWLHPVLPLDALSPARRALVRRPKLLVPGLSRYLEAFEDAEGGWCGAVATLSVLEVDGGPSRTRLATVVQSVPARALYRAHFAGQALGGGSVPVSRRTLGELPLARAWLEMDEPDAAGSAAVEAALVVACGPTEADRAGKVWPDPPALDALRACAAALRADFEPVALRGALDALASRARSPGQRVLVGSALLLALIDAESADALTGWETPVTGRETR